MAKKKAAKKSTALTKWDEELARQAEAAAEQEASTGGGQFFSARGGVLKLNDAPVPNNEMAVIIVDGVMENVYYQDKFDPDDPRPPSCYGFGRTDKGMAPHKDVEAPEAKGCADCENNEWGSAETGRGKACRNRRRLAVISAGTLKHDDLEMYDDPEHYLKAQITYLALPPTSLNGYGSWVKQTAATLKRPPHGVIAKVSLVPDDKTQFKIVFETIDIVPDEIMSAIMQRHEESRVVIEFPYPKPEADKPKKKAKKKAKKKRGGKY